MSSYRLKKPSSDVVTALATQPRETEIESPQPSKPLSVLLEEVIASTEEGMKSEFLPGYPWTSLALRERAREAMEGASLAARNGLVRQKNLHISDFLELYHKDLVYGHMVPILGHVLQPFKPAVLTTDFLPDRGRVSWRTDDREWRAVSIEAFGQKLPTQALSALDLIRQSGAPFQDMWVVHDVPVPRPQLPEPRLDPYLAGRMWRYLISIAWWL